MGQALSSETMSISGGDGHRYWVGLKMKPLGIGCKKTVFKGVLMGSGPRQWEKVIAKAFTDIRGTKEAWAHEVNKADLTRQLAASFLQELRRICKISVVIPGIVQMDKVSNTNNWIANKNGLRGLDRNEWISVEEFIPGNMHRYCPWTDEHAEQFRDSEHLQTFSHFTYRHSCGTLVACDFQGTRESRGDSPPHYVFTDSIIHSTTRMYGNFDKGEFGITEFFKRHKCNEVCRSWPKPTPLTPPPSFDQACALQLMLTPPPAFENIVFSSRPVGDNGDESLDNNTENRRRRHGSAHGTRSERRVAQNSSSNLMEVPGSTLTRRRSIGATARPNCLGAPRECVPGTPKPSDYDLSQPPRYSIVCPEDSRRRSSSFGNMIDSLPNSHNRRDFIVAPGQNGHNSDVSSRAHHPHLTMTFSDPECRLLDRPRSAGSNCNSDTNLVLIGTDDSDERRDRTSSASSMSALRRRRMMSQHQKQSDEQVDDMVGFYLGSTESELPPLRVTPTAPPVEDSCFSND